MQEPTTKADAVRNLQRYLRRLSYEHPEILPVPVDGIFADRTTEALSSFQRIFSLPVTGRADKRTWDTLFEEYRRLLRQKDRQRFPDFFPRIPADYETRLGETSFFISLLQWMLQELRIAYDSLPDLPMSGVFDDATAASVTEFQRIHGLPMSGRVNRAVWNRLAEEYNSYAT